MKKFKNKKTGAIVNVPETHEKQYIDSVMWDEYKEVKKKETVETNKETVETNKE